MDGKRFNSLFDVYQRMILDRLRDLIGTTDVEDRELYRCVNCGDEFERDYRECPQCGGPYLATVEGDSHNA